MSVQVNEERVLTFGQAIKEALAEELRRDERVFIIGEDVGEAGTAFKVLSGLIDEFGPDRVIDSPISEAGITGIGVGAAMTGMRPAAQHSQSLHAWFSHVPGLKVVVPSTPYDAKGLLKAAIRDDNPVAFFEDKMMYQTKGHVPEEEYVIPLGQADIKREGTDITLVATSSMIYVALEAAGKLAEQGISAEVIDPRTTLPLDCNTLVESAKKTSRAIVIDEGYEQYGVTGEIASVIADGAFYYLDAPVKRMGAMNVPIPFSPVLEDVTVPTAEKVTEQAKVLCGRV